MWGGYAYGRGLDGAGARADMESAFRRIAVAAKNIDTREHDIADSDDYFQYHGGMVAMVRAPDRARARGLHRRLAPCRTRCAPAPWPRRPRGCSGARVVNPRWIAAMRRHGYKGAFELAATVDYLFGYDATAGVVDGLDVRAARRVLRASTSRPAAFLRQSNPWALRGIAERLLEAADRGLWADAGRRPPWTQLREPPTSRLEGELEGRRRR